MLTPFSTPTLTGLLTAACAATASADEASDAREFRGGSSDAFRAAHEAERAAHRALVNAVLAAGGTRADAWFLLRDHGTLLVG